MIQRTAGNRKILKPKKMRYSLSVSYSHHLFTHAPEGLTLMPCFLSRHSGGIKSGDGCALVTSVQLMWAAGDAILSSMASRRSVLMVGLHHANVLSDLSASSASSASLLHRPPITPLLQLHPLIVITPGSPGSFTPPPNAPPYFFNPSLDLPFFLSPIKTLLWCLLFVLSKLTLL